MTNIGHTQSNFYTNPVRYRPIQSAQFTQPVQTLAPKVQTNVNALRDALQHVQTTTKPAPSIKLGLVDKSCLGLGVGFGSGAFLGLTLRTAIKNNPRIEEFCNEKGIGVNIESKNLDDTSPHARTTAAWATKIAEFMSLEGANA